MVIYTLKFKICAVKTELQGAILAGDFKPPSASRGKAGRGFSQDNTKQTPIKHL